MLHGICIGTSQGRCCPATWDGVAPGTCRSTCTTPACLAASDLCVAFAWWHLPGILTAAEEAGVRAAGWAAGVGWVGWAAGWAAAAAPCTPRQYTAACGTVVTTAAAVVSNQWVGDGSRARFAHTHTHQSTTRCLCCHNTSGCCLYCPPLPGPSAHSHPRWSHSAARQHRPRHSLRLRSPEGMHTAAATAAAWLSIQ